MTGFPTTNAQTSKLYRMDHNARIEAAIEDLESQDHLNVTAAAKKMKNRTRNAVKALSRRNYLALRSNLADTQKPYERTRRNSYYAY
jgi:hypothetical protein